MMNIKTQNLIDQAKEYDCQLFTKVAPISNAPSVSSFRRFTSKQHNHSLKRLECVKTPKMMLTPHSKDVP